MHPAACVIRSCHVQYCLSTTETWIDRLVHHVGPAPAPQPARRPAGSGSAAKPPLPISRKQSGTRMSRFAPEGARPAVQTARVHAELGIPAVLPSHGAVQSTSKAPMPVGASGAPVLQTPPAEVSAAPEASGPAQAVPDAVQSTQLLQVPRSKNVNDRAEAQAVPGDDDKRPAGWQQLLELAEEASEPPRQFQQQVQDVPATPPQAQAYSRQQFEHPGMTPFPGQVAPSWGGPDSDEDADATASIPSAADDTQDESSCQAKVPALGPPGQTPFPHLAATTPSTSAEEQDEENGSADSPPAQAAVSLPDANVLRGEAGVIKQKQVDAGKGTSVPLRMLMQHLQGGSYDSPAANRPLKFAADSPPGSSPTTPPAQVTSAWSSTPVPFAESRCCNA